MTPISLHPFLFYFLIGFCVILMALISWIVYKWLKALFDDYILFIDSSNRWSLIRTKLKSLDTYDYNGKKYFITDKEGLMNSKGKLLYVFSVNKPSPMKLEYNSAKWLTSDSLMYIINNKLIQKLVQLSDKFSDTLMLFGALGGVIAGIASVVILLKQFGVIS